MQWEALVFEVWQEPKVLTFFSVDLQVRYLQKAVGYLLCSQQAESVHKLFLFTVIII